MKRARMCAAFAATLILSTALTAMPSVAQQAPAAKAAAPAAPSPAAADAAQKQAAQKQKEADAAKRAYEAGIKSYSAGKFEPAVQSLSAALRGGGLSSQDMARGLYYRGLAYKKQTKPGLAISDLTSALWLKNGLSDADRQSATAERAEAYKLAGLGDGNSGAETVAVADPNGKSQTAASPPVPAPAATTPDQVPVAAAPVPTANASPAVNDGSIRSPFADSDGPPPKVARQAAPTQTQAPGGASGAAKSNDGAFDQLAALQQPRVEPANTPAVQPAPAPAVPAPIPEQSAAGSSNNTVGGFFSNLFGGGTAAPAEPAPVTPAPVTTASTNQPTPATSSWTEPASVASGAKVKTAPAAKVAPPTTTAAVSPAVAAPKAAAPAQPQVKGGKFKLHIAAMRSRSEAEALAQKLTQQYGTQFAARAPTVDEAVIGSMGTFYRVRVGSYATADEPRGLCNTLRNSGYDCLVVTN